MIRITRQMSDSKQLKLETLLSSIRKLEQFRPAIITDIDGVLFRGAVPIPRTIEALRKIKLRNIPFACLTNGGGQMEETKAQKMNKIIGEDYFTGEQMFLNHTPLKPKIKHYSLQPGMMLVSGSNKVEEILVGLKVHNFVTADEVYTMFEDQSSQIAQINGLLLNKRPLCKKDVAEKWSQRFQSHKSAFPTTYEEWSAQINSIFALNDLSPYETTLEVIHNLFLQNSKRKCSLPPYFAAQNDIVWAGGYPRPRLAFGPFNYMLEQHCKNHGFILKNQYFGKPELSTFRFVERHMQAKFNTNFYFMIGDNPRADICGANRAKWTSFLTQTGVHQGPENDELNPATFVVYNFEEAVDIILSIISRSC